MSENKKMMIFGRSCFCVSHFATALPAVWFGWAASRSEDPNLAEKIEPVPSDMLSCIPEINILFDVESINSCVELLGSFAGTTLQVGCDAWSYVDIEL